ncbi:MAG: SDR family oxidoreductase [Planctomycetaceae bacterium]|nr:MAG: SDR family oxidoreductase [Planctomycetaceae bacterium]
MDDSGVSLSGKTALVTGAAKRIGRAIALALAQNGARVVVHHNRSEQDAAALCEEIEGIGVSAWMVKGDLVDPSQTEAVFKEAVDQAGPIDILVNNASIFEMETIWETTDESLCRNMRIHTTAALILSRNLAKQQRPGHIINLLDTRVVTYDKEHASYHISKRALLTLTRILALELAPDIAVNAVAPGLILPSAWQDESYLEKLAPTTPLRRHGSPADVVEAVLFLLRSRFITGQIIYVDGGYHMRGHLYD